MSGTAWTGVTVGGGMVAVLLASALAARLLTPTQFGFFIATQGVLIVAAALWDLGGGAHVAREVAAGTLRPGDAVALWVGNRLILAPLAVLAFCLLALPLTSGDATVAAALLAVAALFRSAGTAFEQILRAVHRFRAAALALVAGRLVIVACLAVMLATGADGLVWVAVAWLIGEATGPTLQLLVGRRALRGSWPGLRDQRAALRDGLPYLGPGFVWLAYSRLDVPLVALVAGPAQSAIYAPASRLQDAVLQVPYVASSPVVPVASRRLHRTPTLREARRTLGFALATSLGLTVPLVVLILVATGPLLTLFLGPGYEASTTVTRIIIASTLGVAVSMPFVVMAQAAGRARAVVPAYMVGLAISIVGNLTITRWYGATGAAWVTFGREVVVNVMLVALVALALRERRPSGTPPPAAARAGHA